MNRIINPLSIVLMAAVLSFSLIGCQSTDPVESVPEIEVPVPVPAAEAPAPAPVVEEEDEVPAITGSLSFYGYTLSYEAVPGEARVTYPQFITEADVSLLRTWKHRQNRKPMILRSDPDIGSGRIFL